MLLNTHVRRFQVVDKEKTSQEMLNHHRDAHFPIDNQIHVEVMQTLLRLNGNSTKCAKMTIMRD